MLKPLHITLIAIPAAILGLILVIIILRRCSCCGPKTHQNIQSLHHGIARLHQVSPHHHHNLERGSSTKIHKTKSRPFSWADHPSLVTDAVENGWSGFSFSASSAGRTLFGSSDKTNLEMGWEVCEGSTDLVQKIRLNPDAARPDRTSVIRAGLPLPGPNLGNSSFPQEAYFEITVTARGRVGDEVKISDGDNVKLIIDEEVNMGKGEDLDDGVLVSVGLTAGGPHRLRIPGSYPGSVAFRSTGSLILDGRQLVSESENDRWGKPYNVIGCGYNPIHRKVFFTVNSQLVHEIHCKTDDFSSPLYPTLASNIDITVLLNLGQSPFKYSPANSSRTPNPCFILGHKYEDSRELFSMGRIDSQWLQRSVNRNTVTSIKGKEYDQESDGDLFEIVLDGSAGRSPYLTLNHP